MAGLSHTWGEDLELGIRGGLRSSDTTERTQQRVIRRLMTNPGELLDAPLYGAGLRQFIGQPMMEARIRATILQQMRLEPGVSQSTPPTVKVDVLDPTSILATVTYADEQTGVVSRLSLPINTETP